MAREGASRVFDSNYSASSPSPAPQDAAVNGGTDRGLAAVHEPCA